MFKEIETGTWVCHKKLGEIPYAIGNDSLVFRDGVNVEKAYVGGVGGKPAPLSEQQFNLYWYVTNQAYQISETEGLFVKLPYSKKSLVLRVNPILSARTCDCGYVEATSRFIGGDDLEYLPHKYDSKEIVIGLRQLGYELEERFNVSGIYLAPINIKTAEDDSLMATDLCSDITKLRKR